MDRHPDQVFILDHFGKPRVAAKEVSPWQERIKDLAKRQNAYCKISGLVTEAKYRHWTEEQLKPYFDVVLEVFGPRRLMFGSDWPVCLVVATYGQVKQLVEDYVDHYAAKEKEKIFGESAIRFYGLKASAHGLAA